MNYKITAFALLALIVIPLFLGGGCVGQPKNDARLTTQVEPVTNDANSSIREYEEKLKKYQEETEKFQKQISEECADVKRELNNQIEDVFSRLDKKIDVYHSEMEEKLSDEVGKVEKKLNERIEEVNDLCKKTKPEEFRPFREWWINIILLILALVVGILTLLVTMQSISFKKKQKILKNKQKIQSNEIQDILIQIFVESARRRLFVGDKADVIAGADILSQLGTSDIDGPVLRELLKRKELSEEVKETLERAIRDLEKKTK